MVVILTGTMPDIIKQAPLVWEAEKRNKEVLLIHSGQHMDDKLFKNQYNSIGLRHPDIVLENMEDIKKHIKNDDIVLVHGDTNTARVGALTSHLNGFKVGHVEAGLRTKNREPFPEQTNTRIVDACSYLYFAPTYLNIENLCKEGYTYNDIYLTGNTVIDIVKKFSQYEIRRVENRVWFCVHRNENMNNPKRMENILKFLETISKKHEVHFIDRQRTSWINIPKSVIRHDPMPYRDSLDFMRTCEIVVTDSGSIQEETSYLKIPTLTVRNETDRPETLNVSNILGGTTYNELLSNFYHTKSLKFFYNNIYGVGCSSEFIFDILENRGY